jgi:hypothetical protein
MTDTSRFGKCSFVIHLERKYHNGKVEAVHLSRDFDSVDEAVLGIRALCDQIEGMGD